MTPTLDAYDNGTGWVVWCDHCKLWHHHGAAPGHRVAHCADDASPYQDTGYTLELRRQADPADQGERRPMTTSPSSTTETTFTTKGQG